MTCVLLVSTQANAQNHPSMRSMAALQLFQYGQAVYERGDYSQAAIVFTKLLSMDPNNEAALKYARKLNSKGEHIAIPVSVIKAPVVRAKKALRAVMQTPLKDKQVVTQQVQVSELSDQMDLKQDINEANLAIEQLKNQVFQLRQQITQEPKDLTYLESNN
jgi:tetratricopeptide (TPR) repeat protein